MSFERETNGQTETGKKKKKKVGAVNRVRCTRTGTRARRAAVGDEYAHAHRKSQHGHVRCWTAGAPEKGRRGPGTTPSRPCRSASSRCSSTTAQPWSGDRTASRTSSDAFRRNRRSHTTPPHTTAHVRARRPTHVYTERNAHARATERWRSHTRHTRTTHALAGPRGGTGRKYYIIPPWPRPVRERPSRFPWTTGAANDGHFFFFVGCRKTCGRHVYPSGGEVGVDVLFSAKIFPLVFSF